MVKTYMATDQFGHTYHDLGQHPRKELMKRLGYKSATRIYRDGAGAKKGESWHVGWKIGPFWLDVYEVIPVRVPSGFRTYNPGGDDADSASQGEGGKPQCNRPQEQGQGQLLSAAVCEGSERIPQ